MGIRIQPLDIEIPETDPFKNDLLGRKEPVEVLTHLIGSIEGPCVLAVDAAWGAGKTTFLKIWSQYLRNRDFPVVEFNAWETDFSGDPFITLSGELTGGLHQYADPPLAGKIDAMKKVATEVVRRVTPAAIKIAIAWLLDVSQIIEKEIGQVLASSAEDRMSSYRKEQETVKEFREKLQDLADTLAESKEGRPLVIVIDELDRCRPSYAIELLEVAKHLFTVDHIIFVLAVNRSELEHSIRALYGSGFDAQGYLRRVFDVDFRLPEAARKPFIETLLETIKIGDYFERTKDPKAEEDYEVVRKLLLTFFVASDLSLRQIAQAIHRLGLVFASLRSDQWSFAIPATVALILRTISPDMFRQFISGTISDVEVVERIFNRSGAESLRQQHTGHLFEATIIAASYEDESVEQLILQNQSPSQLLQRYKDLAPSNEADEASLSPEQKRAREVILLVGDFRREMNFRRQRFGFREAVQRIELLSPSLVDKSAPEAEDS